MGRDQMWVEGLLGQEEESGLHLGGDEGPRKGSEKEHAAVSLVGKNDLPGAFPVPSLEGWVEGDWKASRRRAGCSDGSGERRWQGAGRLAGPQGALRTGRISSCQVP